MRVWKLGVPGLAVAASATLFGLAFPPAGWKPLAWVALAPFFAALRGGGAARTCLLTWLWCLMAAWAVGDWFPRSVASYFQQSLFVSMLLFFGVFTVMAGPYYLAFAFAYRALARRFDLALPFLAAAAWVGAELGRGRLLTDAAFFIGNPWGLVGYSHADFPPLLQIASVTGIYGLSFAVAAVNAAIAEGWLRRRELGPRGVALRASAALLPGAVFLLYGLLVLRSAEPPAAAPTPVALVQPNLKVGSRWRSDLYGRNLDVYLELTHRASREGDPAIVFWPEAAMTFFLEDEPAYRRAIARVLSLGDLELVAGGTHAHGPNRSLFSNSIFALAPDGSIRGRYDKEYLVPFAEYFPLGIDVLRRRFGRIRYFEPGTETAPLDTRAGPAGVIVCNESMLPEVVSRRVAAGAAYLVNPTNDTWISDVKYTEQQLHIAILRAVEQRRYLVRASTAGPSAVIDPWGRLQIRAEPFTRGVILGEVRPISKRSLYGRLGDAFALTCVAAVLSALALRRPATRW